MKIRQAEKESGLSAKAIRFYEARGLLSARRTPNGYRQYSNEDITRLKEIAIMRGLGFSVADLKLLQNGVLPLCELVGKRLCELEKEEESRQGKKAALSRWHSLLEKPQLQKEAENYFWALGEESVCAEKSFAGEVVFPCEGALFLGVDLGSTTISAVLADENGRALESYTLPNNAALPASNAAFHLQNAEKIVSRAQKLIDSVLEEAPVKGVGVAGQMHGILYVNKKGEGLSPLHTWQDKRGDLPYGNSSYAGYMREKTGSPAAAGYGLVTHFYNCQNGLVPAGAAYLCTIMDYLVMRLTGNPPLMHATNAASLGLYCLEGQCFFKDSLTALGIQPDILPAVTAARAVAGSYKNAFVTVAIGDNQASFLGAVENPEKSILVNIGTGSQISVLANAPVPGLEARPYLTEGGKYLLAGSALCGGKAYALLESFFRQIAYAAGAPDKPLYEVMNSLAEKAEETFPLSADTRFCGTRENPLQTGAITGITENNFTPQAFVTAVLAGVAGELRMFYSLAENGKNQSPKRLVASGNGVRKNKALQRALEKAFGMPLEIPPFAEEAALGAARFASGKGI